MRIVSKRQIPLFAALAAFGHLPPLTAQDSSRFTTPRSRHVERWEIAGVPAFNYDADEGFGYGAIVELYAHAAGAQPYRFTIQPTLFLTTEGRRDATIFFDAPALVPRGWRVTAFAGREQQLAQPYYGLGNETRYDPAEEVTNPYYYRYGRTRLRVSADAQHRLGRSPARLLLGGGISRTSVDATPFDSGTTLLASQAGGAMIRAGRGNYLRAGLVWDTRDREIGTRSGSWTELLVQRVAPELGATERYTRWTLSARRYVPVASRVTFAQRITVQDVAGDAPFYELETVQSSFKAQEGLGGSTSIRGIPKDRYTGKSLLLSNSEMRWRAADFALLGRESYLVLTGFLDAGRVWSGQLAPSGALRELHTGYGAGTRLGFGPSFLVAVDVGHSGQAVAPIYIGLGYLF